LVKQVWVTKQDEQPVCCASIGQPLRVHWLVGHALFSPAYTILEDDNNLADA
jgi:hypothetical protein